MLHLSLSKLRQSLVYGWMDYSDAQRDVSPKIKKATWNDKGQGS